MTRRGLALIEASEATASARNEGVVLTFGEHARALLYNGLGQHAAALAPASSASARDELMVSVWALPELVEAACRCGKARARRRCRGAPRRAYPRGRDRAGPRHRGARPRAA